MKKKKVSEKPILQVTNFKTVKASFYVYDTPLVFSRGVMNNNLETLSLVVKSVAYISHVSFFETIFQSHDVCERCEKKIHTMMRILN